jgi:hypothetical protein
MARWSPLDLDDIAENLDPEQLVWMLQSCLDRLSDADMRTIGTELDRMLTTHQLWQLQRNIASRLDEETVHA